MPGLNQIQLVRNMALTQQASGLASAAVPALSQDDRALLAKTEDAAEIGLSEKYFLVQATINGQKVYFIYSPTENGQTVSEGMGYWPTNCVNLSMTEGAHNAKTAHYQEIFNGLIRGALMMRNKNGLPGWRCFFHPDTKILEFRSADNTNSASDADIYITWALILAQSLVDKGVWKETPGLNYKKLAEGFLARIKGLDVITLRANNGTEKYVLTVSDSWGEKDIKNYVTVNPSYGILSAMVDFAKFDSAGRVFWLKLRKDTFDIIEKSQNFGEMLYKETQSDAFDNGDGTVTLDYQHTAVLRSMLGKITPSSPSKAEEIEEFRRHGIKYNTSREHPSFDLDRKRLVINKDNAWTISKGCVDFILAKIKEHNVRFFFPDQVEVGLRETGALDIRIEVAAANLDYTENYDAIRVYAELGKDVLFHDDINDPSIPPQYKITSREKALLSKVTAGRYPQYVRASKYDNIIAKASYFMATLGGAAFKEALLGKSESFFEEIRNRPQYYHTSLTVLIASSYIAAAKKGEFKIPEADGPLEKVARKEEKIVLPQPLKFPVTGAVKSPSMNYFLRSIFNITPLVDNDGNIDLSDRGGPSVPEYRLQAERRFYNFKEIKESYDKKGKDDPEIVYLYAVSLLGIGVYEEARKVLLEAILKSLKSEEEAGTFWDWATDGSDKKIWQCISDRTDTNKQKLMTICIKLYADISKTLNIDEYLTADELDWMLKGEFVEPKYKLYLRAAFINKLNLKGRTTEAFREEAKFFQEYKALYKDTPFGCREAESAMGLLYSGENMKLPTPRIDVFASVVCEFAYTISSKYLLEEPDQFEYQERKYYAKQAIALIDAIISGRPLPRTGSKKIDEAISAMAPFAPDIPKDLKSRFQYTKARIILNNVYNNMEDINTKTGLYEGWKHKWFSVEGEPAELFLTYNALLSNCDLAKKILHESIDSQLNGIVQDSDAFSRTLDTLVSANMLKMDILDDASAHYLRFHENEKADIMRRLKVIPKTAEDGKEEEKKIMGRIGEIIFQANADIDYTIQEDKINEQKLKALGEITTIYNSIFGAFDQSFRSAFSTTASPSWLGKDKIKKACQSLVDLSADPRNATHINWILKAVEVYSMLGQRALGSEEASIDLLKESLRLCEKIPTLSVSNPKQRTLFIFRTALSVEETLYYYHEQIGALIEKDPQKYKDFATIRQDAVLMFQMLTGTEVSQKDIANASIRIQPSLRIIKENEKYIKELFKEEPTSEAKAYAKMGNLIWWGAISTEDLSKAKAAYEKALYIDPYSADALIGLANILLTSKKKDQMEIFNLTIKSLRAASVSPDPRLIQTIEPLLSFLAGSTLFTPEDQRTISHAADIFREKRQVDSAIVSEVLEIFREVR